MTVLSRPSHVRILIYIFPALMDMVVAQFLFINTVRVTRMGASGAVVAGVTTVWSLAYLLACFLAGRLATPRNASRWMLLSCVLLATMAALGMVLPGIPAIYLITGLAGASAAFFFPPFQLFMKAVDQGAARSLAYSTGLYTFAWSAGYAVAPLLSGFLMNLGPHGWRLALGSSAVAAVLTAYGILRLQHLAQSSHIPAAPELSSEPAACTNGRPDLAWLAWLGTGAGMLAISIIRAVFPVHAINALHLDDPTLGTLFFLLSMSQAVTGLILCRSRLWMYRALPVFASGVLGVLAMVGLALGHTVLLLALGTILFGVYSGCFFFYLVYHAIAHPVRAPAYVAINEAVVGAGGILGPLAGGLLLDRGGYLASAVVGAAFILLITLFQTFVHRQHPVAAS